MKLELMPTQTPKRLLHISKEEEKGKGSVTRVAKLCIAKKA
jgi:hypothetical protein